MTGGALKLKLGEVWVIVLQAKLPGKGGLDQKRLKGPSPRTLGPRFEPSGDIRVFSETRIPPPSPHLTTPSLNPHATVALTRQEETRE